MAGSLKNIANITTTISNLTKLIANITVSSNYAARLLAKNSITRCQRSLLHTTANRYKEAKPEEKPKFPQGLMEFFDNQENWGASKIKAGRAWKIDELRLKSNEDLHKLWFVLIKERNMLKTMEHACNEEYVVFPNPERIDKVEDSMENIEKVVRERNEAYYLLETGENTGERPSKMVNGPLGLRYWYRMREYVIPRKMNKKFNESHSFHHGGYAVRKFRRRYFEKLWLEKRKEINRAKSRAAKYFRKFPNVTAEAIQSEFPFLTLEQIEKIKTSKFARGHFERD